ncbi:MAG: hypothetical protein AAFX93_17830 [Verrucomicrobiota bacterium]
MLNTVKDVELSTLPWTHPKTGTKAFRVSGYIRSQRIAEKLKLRLPESGRVRKNFKTEEVAIAFIQEAELLARATKPKRSIRTWIKQKDIEWLEEAMNELGDAQQVYYAAKKYRKDRDSSNKALPLEKAIEGYLATKRDADGPHVTRTRNRLKQGMRANKLNYSSDLAEGLGKWLTRTDVSGTSLHNDWIAWHGFCEWLTTNEYLDRNPVKQIAKPRKDTPPPRSLSNDEFFKLIELAEKSELAKFLVPYYAIGGWAGLRPQSEWPHISWDSISLDTEPEFRCIKVIRQKVNRTERYVRIFPILEQKLRQWIEDDWPIGGFNLWGDTSLERSLRREHTAILRSAGIKWQADILRHTYASNAVFNFSKTQLKDQMGTQESTIARYYIHPKPPAEQSAFWSS